MHNQEKEKQQTPQTEQIRERVFKTIEEKNMQPKPYWHFLVREWVVYVVAGSALVLGSVATGLSLYICGASRFMVHAIELSSLDMVFEIVPFLWLALLVVALGYGTYAVRMIKHGYRFHKTWTVGIALGVSIFVGAILYEAGLGATIDNYLLHTVPMYQPATGFRPTHFMDKKGGVFAGEIVEMRERGFVLRMINSEICVVYLNPETVVLLPDNIQVGMRVRVEGISPQEGVCEARFIQGFEGRGRGGR